MNRSNLIRLLLVYGLCLPLAVVVGYHLAQPFALTTVSLVGLLLFVIATPLLLRAYHPILVATWNTTFILILLPGRPYLWLVMAFVSFAVALVLRAVRREEISLFPVKSVAIPLALLLVVTVVTAQLTGGIKFRATGAEAWGGKRYFVIWASILGFFAIASRATPSHRARLYTTLYFLGGLTWAVTSLYKFDPIRSVIYPLYFIFPVDPSAGVEVYRVHGIPFACTFVVFAMQARYGLKGLFSAAGWWRVPVFLASVIGVMTGGFRLFLIMILLAVVIMFFLEGLHKTPAAFGAVIVGLLLVVIILPTARFLPTSFQRSLTWLPVPVDPVVRRDAEITTEWRLRMWQDLLAEVPKHLILGRGLVYDALDYELAASRFYRGPDAEYRMAQVAQDYHNGPISVVLPFGIWGGVAFLWFVVGSFLWLYKAWRYSPAELYTLNCGLFATFAAQMIVFLALYGQFHQDMPIFTGLIGLSVSINHHLWLRRESKEVQAG